MLDAIGNYVTKDVLYFTNILDAIVLILQITDNWQLFKVELGDYDMKEKLIVRNKFSVHFK